MMITQLPLQKFRCFDSFTMKHIMPITLIGDIRSYFFSCRISQSEYIFCISCGKKWKWHTSSNATTNMESFIL